MIRITQIKIATGREKPVGEAERDRKLRKKAAAVLRVKETRIALLAIERHSLDARKKPALSDVYTVRVSLLDNAGLPLTDEKEARLVSRLKSPDVTVAGEQMGSSFPSVPRTPAGGKRPLIAGSGPAGLFCACLLAQNGYRPLLIERGRAVEERTADVARTFETGSVDPVSNVQFGEGGAGTFSDGKLYTSVKDRDGLQRRILDYFVSHGAPKDILTEANPHIGTDLLADVVRGMRNAIRDAGGEVLFETQLTGLALSEDGQGARYVTGAETNRGRMDAGCVVLATGHSARDTFTVLYQAGVRMEAKPFAVGVRVAHSQEIINRAMYGDGCPPFLDPASYKLTCETASGKSVYTFCMCPGGYIINASSGRDALCVNGMSYRDRGAPYANSAVICTVTPGDCARYLMMTHTQQTPVPENTFPDTDVFAGVRFQAALERAAFQAGGGRVPVQLLGGFLGADKESNLPAAAVLSIAEKAVKGPCVPADVRAVLPEEIALCIAEGITAFDKKLHGFSSDDALVAGVESRTSSPVRMVRDKGFESCGIRGLFPCGEGAGYAGGIMSAAADGIRVAEAVAHFLHI